MKKIICLVSLLTAGLFANAQMTMSSYNPYNSGSSPVPLTNGQTWTTNTVSEQGATLYFYINNNYSHDIYVKAKVESITNDSGANFQFCFGENCVFSISEGTVYTGYQQYVTIPAGGTNSMWDKIFNENATGVSPKEFVFKFFRVDASGNELGEEFFLTYKYEPTASLDEVVKNNGLKVNSTIVENEFSFSTDNNMNVTIFDINGRSVLNSVAFTGDNTISVSGLSKGVYIANFTDSQSKVTTVRFIKK